MSRKNRPSKKIRPGHGKPLKLHHWGQLLWRTSFSIVFESYGEESTTYIVDVDYLDWNIDLYRDGRHVALGSYRGRFPAGSGLIHADLSL